MTPDFNTDIKVTSSISGTRIVLEQVMKGGVEVISRRVLETQERHVRECLIKLGWTPPPNPQPLSKDHENTPQERSK